QVGLGGGLVSGTLAAYGIEVETIEVNPGLVDVMRERFGYDGVVHVGDGRAVWRRLDRSYDFVVLDAFQGESLPAHLLTREAFVELHGMLEPGGVVCVHLIGTPAHDAVAAVASTMRSVFAHVRAVRSGAGDELQDLFLFASTRTLEVPPLRVLRRAGWLGNEWFEPNEKGAAVLTDDRNPLDVLGEPLARALRRASRTR
nr:fused MFS/spermidine synthase [Planctomycetota bacterium]